MASNPLMKAIVGSTQSKYVAWAISITILVLCVSILVTQTDIPIGKRLLAVLFMILITVPGVVLSLIEITCLVTGGSWKTNWWCWLLAWIIAGVVIVWCVLTIVATFNSIVTYTNATKNLKKTGMPATEEESNDFAEVVLASSEDLDNVVPSEKIDSELEKLVFEKLNEENLTKKPENVPEFADVDPAEIFGEENLEAFSNRRKRLKEKFSNCSKKHLEEEFSNKKEYFKNRKIGRMARLAKAK